MAKTKISEFSATPANNTDIDSINIAEGCAPSGINDAIRELMAQLKDFQTGAVGDSFNGPIGTTTAAAGAFTTLSASSTLGVTGVSTLTGGAVVQGLTVGRGAGAVATNTAVGSGALQANTSGSQSTAVGYQAGYSNTTGGANVFLGYQAGYTQTTGGGGAGANTYLGYRAGYLSTGYYNTFVGIQAGQNCTGFSNTFVGSTGTMASGDQMTTGTKNIIIGNYSGNNDGLDIRTASNYAVISDGDGNRQITMKEGQTLALDSAVPNAGTGITFPATQSASSNANTLDDYEEGTFTPKIDGSTSTGTGTYTAQNGYYTKIGNRVNFECYIYWTNHTGTGPMRLGGLPFTINNSTNNGSVFPMLTYNISLTANNIASSCISIVNSTQAYFIQTPIGGGVYATVDIDTSGEVFISGSYFV
jgi:hypothetical protein